MFKKSLKITAGILIALTLIDVGTILGFAFMPHTPKKSETLIVFGAKPYSPAMRQRTLHGINLFQENLADKIVFSGGKTHINFAPEAEVMKNIAITQGFASDVILESKSYNSYENLTFTKDKIDIPSSTIFVSDCYHLARLYLMGLRSGYHDISVSCPSQSYYPKQELVFYYFREFAALIWYIPKFILG